MCVMPKFYKCAKAMPDINNMENCETERCCYARQIYYLLMRINFMRQPMVPRYLVKHYYRHYHKDIFRCFFFFFLFF